MQLQHYHKQLILIAAIFCVFTPVFGYLRISLVDLKLPHNDDVVRETVAYATAVIACWITNMVNLLFVQPIWNKQIKALMNYIGSYVLYIFVAIIVWYLVLTQLYQYDEDFFPITEVLLINTFILLMMEVILYKHTEGNTKLEIANYKMIILQAQHEKLKNQLHPHFLFNSLNALKALIKRNPGQAESYLIKLAEFLRFSISHYEQNIVPLEEELKFALYYLEMQKVRFNEALQFQLNIPDNVLKEVQLPVFSLQLLLENAIKHNTFTIQSPLIITIQYIAPDQLLVQNNLSLRLHQMGTNEGLGLKNLSERYQLLIQQDIKVDTTDGLFSVYLKTIPR
jgi:sensor histidine kinase YesM